MCCWNTCWKCSLSCGTEGTDFMIWDMGDIEKVRWLVHTGYRKNKKPHRNTNESESLYKQ